MLDKVFFIKSTVAKKFDNGLTEIPDSSSLKGHGHNFGKLLFLFFFTFYNALVMHMHL